MRSGAEAKESGSSGLSMDFQLKIQCRWFFGKVEGPIGCQGLHPNIWDLLLRDFRSSSQDDHYEDSLIPSSSLWMATTTTRCENAFLCGDLEEVYMK